jgi:ketosteroid isomerase-like protein
MSILRAALSAALLAAVAGCATTLEVPQDAAALRAQVLATERAFAKTMADRDLAAFASFLSEEAVFFGGPAPARGKAEVLARWKRYYEAKEAPFSWEPAEVEVLASGTLALSSGPVFDPAGRRIATFTSVWRREAPGMWRVVLDRGDDACACAVR